MGIEEHGRWISPTEFEFNEPRDMGSGMIMRSVDVSQFLSSDPSITPEMIIEALLDPHGQMESAREVEEEMFEIVCVDCGAPGISPIEPTAEVALTIRCPQCRSAERN